MSYYLRLARGKMFGFIPFPKILIIFSDFPEVLVKTANMKGKGQMLSVHKQIESTAFEERET